MSLEFKSKETNNNTKNLFYNLAFNSDFYLPEVEPASSLHLLFTFMQF